jgi:hypothetical protein
MSVVIRRATLRDAPTIARLAERLFRATFAEHNTPDDMAHGRIEAMYDSPATEL